MTYDPWAVIASQSSGIEGRHLKFAKGIWSIDGTEVDGAKICILMPTAVHGPVLWGSDRKIADRKSLVTISNTLPTRNYRPGGIRTRPFNVSAPTKSIAAS